VYLLDRAGLGHMWNACSIGEQFAQSSGSEQLGEGKGGVTGQGARLKNKLIQ